MTLTAGTGRAVITPPPGIPLSGFVGRGPATDVHDDLWVTALVLADDPPPGGAGEEPSTRLAVVTLDLIGLYSDELVAGLKEAIGSATGIPPGAVFLACSHTHYGPVVAERGDMPGGDGPEAAAYRRQLAKALGECVRAADAARVPVDVAAGSGTARVGVNRRRPGPDGSIDLAPNPSGHVDPELQVLRFDAVPATVGGDESATVASLVSYACHPSSLEHSVRSISADFPGVLRAELERRMSGRALFLQGAAGDIDPPDKRPDWSRPEAIGGALAAAAARASDAAVPVRPTPLDARRLTVSLPRRGAASAPEAERELVKLVAARDAGDPADPTRWWLDLKVAEGQLVVRALAAGGEPTIDADVSALRIGEIAIAFIPAELFSELGVMVKERSPAAMTLIAGYTDGMLWYVPTRAAFDEGGYEVVDACRVAPGAGELLVDHVVALLHELFKAEQ